MTCSTLIKSFEYFNILGSFGVEDQLVGPLCIMDASGEASPKASWEDIYSSRTTRDCLFPRAK